jgi:tRNA A-37 threonylcarbamoyl transferase component Bud32
MVSTELGACEWFVWDLRRSNLIDRGQLDQIVGEFLSKHPGAEPPALADYLVEQQTLTRFQADRLLQGKTQGFVLGPFTLMDALGTGSMGTVYKARSKTDNAWYAVKVLPRRSMWNVRIARRKVRAFEQCQHPSVVPFVDVGTSGGMHYLAWPMVEGETLEKIVQQKKQLSPHETVAFALQAAEGLEAAHQQDLFHGLLKPSNLMLGSDGVLRILDFGIGCLLAETEGESLVDTMSTANSVNSGLDCASPESIMDPTNLTAIGDQYSLGCVMYFCLTGQYPFPEGTAVEKMMCHQHKQPTSIKSLVPDAPDDLVQIIEKLMQKNPTDRYVKTSEVIEVLQAFNAGAPAGTVAPRRPSGQMPRPPLPKPSAAAPPNGEAEPVAAASPVRVPRPAPPLPKPAATAKPAAPAKLAAPAKPAGSPRAAAPKQAKTAPTPPVAVAQVAEATPEAPADEPAPQAPRASAMQRLGPIGIILLAVMAGAIAWLVSSFIK